MKPSRVIHFLAGALLLIFLVSLGAYIGFRDDATHRSPLKPRLAAPLLIPVAATDALQPSAYTFDVTSSGEAVWGMPIWAPAGRNGLTPSLSFSYRSRREPGLMGHGFGISGLSVITRCWRTVAQDGRLQAGPILGRRPAVGSAWTDPGRTPTGIGSEHPGASERPGRCPTIV